MNNLNNQIKPANIALIVAFAFLTMISCSPAKKDSQQTPALSNQQQSQEKNTENTESSTDVTDEADATDEDTETAEQQSTEENNSQVTINPPHGEPGHRCDIPVGQPLNAAPSQNTASTSTNNPTAPTIENARRLNSSQGSRTSAPTSSDGTRINPPHGQPGHRCDVPVGSPLP